MHGLDELYRNAPKPITPDSEAFHEEVYQAAKAITARHPLPVGYIVKAVVRCNQIDTFRHVACDFNMKVEVRHENVEASCRAILSSHLLHAHPHLSGAQRFQLVSAITYNFSDIGR